MKNENDLNEMGEIWIVLANMYRLLRILNMKMRMS